MQKPRETKKALVVVRTYPTPAKKGVEVSCTAAITEKGEWLRLHPIPYRFLLPDQRFGKYQWIELTVTKSSDARPESYTPIASTIKIVSKPLPTTKKWQARKRILFPLRAHCLCCLARERDEKGHPTLGFFRPKTINRLVMSPSGPNWTHAQLAILRQEHLFEKRPAQELEKIPFIFRYEFECEDDSCRGHKIFCTDWEMGESYRKWRAKYGDEWEAKFRQRWETDMIQKNDTHFFVGTVRRYPKTWIIVGLFYPPRTANKLLLFSTPA